MEILNIIYLVISILCLFFLVLPFLNIFFSVLKKEKLDIPVEERAFDFGHIITAYRNADIARGLVESLLRQPGPKQHIYLVADRCDLSGWDIIHPRLTVLKPEDPLNLKVKSIIYATEHFVRPHDYITVFDADNLAHPDFVKVINRYANAGYLAIQGQRTAKNLDTLMAGADALGEFYKNYTERLAPYKLGSSSVISGSGMAVESNLYKAYLESPEIKTGKNMWKKMLQEDKILQNFILRQNIRIAYAWDAICYDEKVEDAKSVETQRSRWLFSYFQNLPNSTGMIRRGLTGGSWNQFWFGLITVAPPMFILLFSSLLLALAGIWIAPVMSIALLTGIALFSLTIFWSLYLSRAPRRVWQSVMALPGFVLRQVAGLFKMGNPNKNFKHTEHKRNVRIEELLK